MDWKQIKETDKDGRGFCDGCGREVDWETCYCGETTEEHRALEHSPVPYGCDCCRHYEKEEVEYKLRQARRETSNIIRKRVEAIGPKPVRPKWTWLIPLAFLIASFALGVAGNW